VKKHENGFVVLGLSLQKGIRVDVAINVVLEFVSNKPLTACGVLWNTA
jgi:hypothetical protein